MKAQLYIYFTRLLYKLRKHIAQAAPKSAYKLNILEPVPLPGGQPVKQLVDETVLSNTLLDGVSLKFECAATVGCRIHSAFDGIDSFAHGKTDTTAPCRLVGQASVQTGTCRPHLNMI